MNNSVWTPDYGWNCDPSWVLPVWGSCTGLGVMLSGSDYLKYWVQPTIGTCTQPNYPNSSTCSSSNSISSGYGTLPLEAHQDCLLHFSLSKLHLLKFSRRRIGYYAPLTKSSWWIWLWLRFISCRVSAITVDNGIITLILLFSKLISSRASHCPDKQPKLQPPF